MFRRFAGLAAPPYAQETYQDPSVLLALPDELLEYVTEKRDLSETCSLSLCSKRLYCQLGTRWRYELFRVGHAQDDERERLLHWIAHDYPRLHFCYTCARVH